MGRPNFRIIESHKDYSDIYEDFKKDYLSKEITVPEILEKYNISQNAYYRIKEEVAEETGVNSKPTGNCIATKWKYETRYIEQLKSTGKYRVSKFINGYHKHFGLYNDLKTAIYVRDTLEKNNWSDEAYEKLKWKIHEVDESTRQTIDEIYPEFKKDFMEGHTIKYLMGKYGLTRYKYSVISRLIRSEMGIMRKPQMSERENRLHERGIGG